MLFIIHSSGIVVFDGPIGGWGSKAVRSIDNSSSITHFIYSHYHSDHVADAGSFKETGTIFIAQSATTEYLKARAAEPNSLKLPIPNVTFCQNYTFKVDNYQVELSALKNSHAEGVILGYLPIQKILWQIDVVFPRWVPFHNMGEMENADIHYANLETILSYDFNYMVCGHLGRLGNKDDVTEAKTFYTSLLNAANEFQANDPTNYYKFLGTDSNFWNFLRSWYDDAACKCAQKLISQWKDLLGGIDIWIESACWYIQERMRIGANPLNAVSNSAQKLTCATSSGSVHQVSFLLITMVFGLLFNF